MINNEKASLYARKRIWKISRFQESNPLRQLIDRIYLQEDNMQVFTEKRFFIALIAAALIMVIVPSSPASTPSDWRSFSARTRALCSASSTCSRAACSGD